MDNILLNNHAAGSGNDPVLAMAYVLPQTWKEVYDINTAICRGTIFPCLDKPFLGHEVHNGRK